MSDPTLIEQVVTAWRQRVRGQIRALPAYYDLDDEGRLAAFDQTLTARELESAVDPDGLSTTARAVLRRIDPTR